MSRLPVAVRPLVGLLAGMASEFNDSVVSAALGDVSDALRRLHAGGLPDARSSRMQLMTVFMTSVASEHL